MPEFKFELTTFEAAEGYARAGRPEHYGRRLGYFYEWLMRVHRRERSRGYNAAVEAARVKFPDNPFT